jgi:hypothetical protein
MKTEILFRLDRIPKVLMVLSLMLAAVPCSAQSASTPAAGGSGFFAAIEDYFLDWFPRVTRIQSEQPHWVTPIVTVTPRLEEEFRYDQFWQTNPHGQATDNFGGSKGLELIPFENVELILGVPAWIAHNGHIPHATKKETPPTDGWADETFLIKYRLLSANEENGNYMVTAFMGFSAPTGDDGNSNHHGIFTPTIAAGKGFGAFDVQSTAGISLPDGGLQRLGMPLAWNTAFQYRIFKYLWPEFEVNYTWWPNGQREGQTQVFLTPGLIIGRIPVHERIGITAGFGYQIAVTDHPAYHHAAILTGRIPF